MMHSHNERPFFKIRGFKLLGFCVTGNNKVSFINSELTMSNTFVTVFVDLC